MELLRSRITVSQAHAAFKQGRYTQAKSLYQTLSAEMGSQLFNANIKLCERRQHRSSGLRAVRAATA